LTLTEITNALDLQKSSVYRLLKTLVAAGYLDFNPRGRRYVLGQQLAQVAKVFTQSRSLAWIVRPYLDELRDKTLESAAVQVRDGDDRLCLLESPSKQLIRLEVTEGTRHLLSTGASGLALRAYAPDWANDPNRTELERVRSLGYALRRGDLTAGALGIYVPLFTRDDKLIATIGIQGPEYRISPRSVKRFVALLFAVAADLKPQLDSTVLVT
jgi:DNA-binding IclR family transcriptional regulator